MSRKLYCPADAPLAFTFRAHKFTLEPNAVQGVTSPWADVSADVIVDHALAQLAKAGVREVFGDERDAAIKAESEAAHTDFLCDTAGVPRPQPVVSDEVSAARAGLVKRGVLKA